MDCFEHAVVMDNGSSTCRLGFAFEDAPRSAFNNCIGRPIGKDASKDEWYVGSNAQERREILSLHFPVQRGIVTNWDDMEKIWDFSFSDVLGVTPSEFPVITSEPPLNPKANAETMAEVMFEKFSVPYFQVGYEPKFIFMGLGRDWGGIVLNIGHGVTYTTVHYEGHGPLSIVRSDFGGDDLTKYLQQALFHKGHSFTSSAEMDILADMKEKVCSVSPESSGGSTYRLPDGTVLDLGSDKWKCPDLMFCPDGHFNCGPSLPDMIVSCLKEVCLTTRRDLAFVYLTGGTSLCDGLKEKLHSVLSKLVPHRVVCHALPERKYVQWIGQAIAAQLTTFQHFWLSKQQYEEFGPTCVHQVKSWLVEKDRMGMEEYDS